MELKVSGKGIASFVMAIATSMRVAFHYLWKLAFRPPVIERMKPTTDDRVTFTDEAVTHIRNDGVVETIRWDDLHEVSILTTDEGPTEEDVFFLLADRNGKPCCFVPQFSDGSKELVDRLLKLPGFDYGAVIKAMGSTSNARFLCWKRHDV